MMKLSLLVDRFYKSNCKKSKSGEHQMSYPLPESNGGALVNAIVLHYLIKYVG
jgi:hypothetical protein